MAPPVNSLFTDDFGTFDGSDWKPPARRSDLSQELTYDVSHNSASVHDSQQHLLGVRGKVSAPPDSIRMIAGHSGSYNYPAELEIDQGQASSVNTRFTERILRDPECFSTSEDKISSSVSAKITNTPFSTSQTDIATFPESGNIEKLQLTSDLASLEAPLQRHKTFPDRGVTTAVESALGISEETLSLPMQLDFHKPASVSLHTLGDQVAPEEDNRVRSETEPFQVKVNKNLRGLGMKVCATPKGAVISDIQRMGPIGRTGDIR